MDYAKESLKMHYELRGKLEVTSRAAVDTKDALILPYTPGVAGAVPGNSERCQQELRADQKMEHGSCCYRWNRSSRTWRYRPGGRHAGHGRKMRAV